MTTITLFSKEGGLVGFEARGHTGFASSGSDIVCSAISALTTAAANGITEILHLPAAVETGDGWLYAMLEEQVAGQDLEKARIILDTMALGLASIAETYGDSIKIIERKV
ncbi:MAG: ribosomal-processing cysteine protease Prp [Candidatus Pelethousia sp.]|nr:ribosomal-processing cysteine protease Prp [Candidatus Pelethousia sp.]